jgi:exonuclease III
MRFGTRNVRSLYKAGSLQTAASELSKYKVDLVEVQEVKWGNSEVSHEKIVHFYMGMGTLIIT